VRIGIALGDRVEQVDIPEEEVISLPAGIVGFEDLTRYALFELESPLYLLQSVDDPLAGFVVVDPFLLDPAYRIGKEVGHESLNLADGDRRTVLCVVTLSQFGLPQSANLRAPIIINSTKRVGLQAILQEEWQVRHPLRVSPEGKFMVNSAVTAGRS